MNGARFNYYNVIKNYVFVYSHPPSKMYLNGLNLKILHIV